MNIPLRLWLEMFNNNEFNNPSTKTQIKAGWYDWFCRDSSLHIKTETLGKIVVRISKSDKIDVDNMYVWFKNNCPLYGSLYDDIRFSDIKTGTNIWVVTPKCGHKSTPKGKKSNVSGESSGYANIVTGTMKDVYNFFGV